MKQEQGFDNRLTIIFGSNLQEFSVVTKSEHGTNGPGVDLVSQVVEERDVVVVDDVQALSLPEIKTNFNNNLRIAFIVNSNPKLQKR